MHRSSFNEYENRYTVGSVHSISGIMLTPLISPVKHKAILISGTTSLFGSTIVGSTVYGEHGITVYDQELLEEYSTDQNLFTVAVTVNETLFLELEIVSIISSGGSANATITFLS